MKWLKHPPVKTGLYWAKLFKQTEAQVVRVSECRIRGMYFEIIGEDKKHKMGVALAWCSRRPMKPQMEK